MADDPKNRPPVRQDSWIALRRFTAARIALGRAGVSQPTDRHLAFQYAHAQARDAVHAPADMARLSAELTAMGCEAVTVRSAAGDRSVYLQRPDLGRRLDAQSRKRLETVAAARIEAPDVALVVGDGLSATAIKRHAIALLALALPGLAGAGLRLGPIVLVEQARVAIGDEIGEIMDARAVVVLIGERPGLSSPDSLGVYLTYGPRVGRTDAERNCISNIRPEGLVYDAAARTLAYLLGEAFRRGLSGVALKDDSDEAAVANSRPAATFLTDQRSG